MTIIITMAGRGSRFREAGYDMPKFMIKAKGKTLFEWSMDSLLDFNKKDVKYIFVARREDNAADFIREKCACYGINNITVIELDYTTDGQATTCLLAVEKCNPDDGIFIYNIDTYIEPYFMKESDISGDGHIPCFKADGTHWSFVRADSDGKVVEVKEKVRISDYCSVGAYYFSSAKLYKELYSEFYADEKNIQKNEKYIAPLYGYMLEKGLKVTYSLIPPERVHVLGTPEELNEFLNT